MKRRSFLIAITGSATAMVIPAKASTDGGPTAEDCKKRGMYTANIQAMDAESLRRTLHANRAAFSEFKLQFANLSRVDRERVCAFFAPGKPR